MAIQLIFQLSDQFGPILSYFRRRGNYLTQQQELKVAFEQGILDDPDDVKAYKAKLSMLKRQGSVEEDLDDSGQSVTTSRSELQGEDD